MAKCAVQCVKSPTHGRKQTPCVKSWHPYHKRIAVAALGETAHQRRTLHGVGSRIIWWVDRHAAGGLISREAILGLMGDEDESLRTKQRRYRWYRDRGLVREVRKSDEVWVELLCAQRGQAYEAHRARAAERQSRARARKAASAAAPILSQPALESADTPRISHQRTESRLYNKAPDAYASNTNMGDTPPTDAPNVARKRSLSPPETARPTRQTVVLTPAPMRQGHLAANSFSRIESILTDVFGVPVSPTPTSQPPEAHKPQPRPDCSEVYDWVEQARQAQKRRERTLGATPAQTAPPLAPEPAVTSCAPKPRSAQSAASVTEPLVPDAGPPATEVFLRGILQGHPATDNFNYAWAVRQKIGIHCWRASAESVLPRSGQFQSPCGAVYHGAKSRQTGRFTL